MRACLEHLEAKTSTGENYYKKVSETAIKKAKGKKTDIVKEGLNNEILSREEYTAMLPAEDVVAGRFYGTFKEHKQYEQGKAPPLRGIVSCSGTFMENIAIYVEHYLRDLGKSHESYLEDTPDFLRHIEEINSGGKLPSNAMLVVIDAIGLYDNIPPEECVKSVEDGLSEKPSSKVPSGFITRLLQIILEY